MNISIIAAIDLNGAIGYQGELPWPRLSGDLRRFKWLTDGGPVIMGRKTFESIGKPLPNRKNIVLSSSRAFPGTLQAKNFYQALILARKFLGPGKEVPVIGGASLYRAALRHSRLTTLHLSIVHGEFEADTFFPDWEPRDWEESVRVSQVPNEKNPFGHTYVRFSRRTVQCLS